MYSSLLELPVHTSTLCLSVTCDVTHQLNSRHAVVISKGSLGILLLMNNQKEDGVFIVLRHSIHKNDELAIIPFCLKPCFCFISKYLMYSNSKYHLCSFILQSRRSFVFIHPTESRRSFVFIHLTECRRSFVFIHLTECRRSFVFIHLIECRRSFVFIHLTECRRSSVLIHLIESCRSFVFIHLIESRRSFVFIHLIESRRSFMFIHPTECRRSN